MPPKRNRIPKSDFKRIFKEGRYSHSNNLTLLYSENKSLEEPQFAVIIKSKITNAVGRNTIKRKIRSILVKNIKSIKKDLQVIFIVKNKTIDNPGDEVESLLKKANLLEQ